VSGRPPLEVELLISDSSRRLEEEHRHLIDDIDIATPPPGLRHRRGEEASRVLKILDELERRPA